jgi:hypothetical protein
MISKIMNNPGVYLFKDGAGKVMYVGKTKSFKNRLSHHNHLPKEVYDNHVSTEYREVLDDEERDSLEKRLILKHNPPFNQTHNTVFCKLNEIPETILSCGETLYKCRYPVYINSIDLGKKGLYDTVHGGHIKRYAAKRCRIALRSNTSHDCYVYTSKNFVEIIEKLMLNRWREDLLSHFLKNVPQGLRFNPITENDSIKAKIYHRISDTVRDLIKEEFDEINPTVPWSIPREE